MSNGRARLPSSRGDEATDGFPLGWDCASLATLGDRIRGVSYSRGDASSTASAKLVPILRANNITESGLVFDDLVYVPSSKVSDTQRLRPGDIVIAMSSGSKAVVGKAAQLNEAWTGAFGAFCGVLRPSTEMEAKYLGYFLKTQEYRTAISDMAAGTNINNLKAEHFEQIVVPVAPFAEQQRIVVVLDAVLAKVASCQARLARIPTLLKRFRQAVLAAACSGRLTADWRDEQNGEQSAKELRSEILSKRKTLWPIEQGRRKYVSPVDASDEFDFEHPEGWQRCSMDELTSTITSGSRDWKQYYREDGPGTFVMAQNIRPLKFDDSYRLAVAPPANNRDRVRSEVRSQDVLVTIVGANTGDVCRVRHSPREHYVCQSVALMRPVVPETAAFIELFLNSVSHGLAQYRKWIYGEGRPHLSFDHLRETAVMLPPLAEQQEIVRRVDALFAVADKLEARYEAARRHVDRLTQSVLAKAFRGELVPTEHALAAAEGRDYEPADKLLARIADQTVQPPPRRGTRRRSNV